MIVQHIGYTVDLDGNSHPSSCRSLPALKALATRRGHPIIIQEEHHYMRNDYEEVVPIGVVYFVFMKTPDGWESPDDVTPSGTSLKNVIQVMTNKMF